MDYRDVFVMAIEGVSEQKFRFALNLLGILIGCAAVTGLISLTQGMNIDIADQMSSLGANTINVIPGEIRAQPMGEQGASAELDWRDVELIEKIKDVDIVSPSSEVKSCYYYSKGDPYFLAVTGISEDYSKVNTAIEIAEGRGLLRTDKATALIGSKIAQPDPEDDPIFEVGDRIKIYSEVDGVEKELTLRVIGVMKETGGSFGTSDTAVYIPLRTHEQFFETTGVYGTIHVLVDEQESVKRVANLVEEEIKGVTAVTSDSAMEMAEGVLGTLGAVLSAIAGISLLVAGVGIVNTMTVSVMERTKEIGIMKAIGANNNDILALFLSEAAFTGLLGGIIGAVFGFLLSNLIGRAISIPASTTLSLGIMVVGFAIITAVLSGFYPARRASRLNPVEALRNE